MSREYPRRLLGRLLGVFFKLLYHPLAWTYDAVAGAVSVGRWQGWVLSAAEQVEGRRILELGFGPGHLQARLNAEGKRVFGLDESAQMARQARRRLLRRQLPARLARGLAQNLPFPTASFDCVVATFPTPYIFQPETLAEIYRVLASGGRVVVLFAAWITGGSLADRAAAQLFQITGQVPQAVEIGEAMLAPFRQAGFAAELREIERPGSRLLYIFAHKTSE